MLGKIKRRWRRFRYNNQVRYPSLFRFWKLFKFPVQIVLLSGALWVLVGWYSNYMTLAKIQSPTVPDHQTSLTITPVDRDTVPSIGDATADLENPASANPVPAKNVAAKQLEVATLKLAGEPTAVEQAVSVTPSIVPIEKPLARGQTSAVKDADWMLRQKAGFMVQLSSSPHLDRLSALAERFGEIEPIAIYPFQTQSGKKLYGLATGYYRDYQEALQSIKDLPARFNSMEPWIRSLNDLQQAITAAIDPENIAVNDTN